MAAPEADVADDCCRVCLIEHDPEIHRATLEIHAWLRADVLQGFDGAPPERQYQDKGKKTFGSIY